MFQHTARYMFHNKGNRASLYIAAEASYKQNSHAWLVYPHARLCRPLTSVCLSVCVCVCRQACRRCGWLRSGPGSTSGPCWTTPPLTSRPTNTARRLSTSWPRPAWGCCPRSEWYHDANRYCCWSNGALAAEWIHWMELSWHSYSSRPPTWCFSWYRLDARHWGYVFTVSFTYVCCGTRERYPLHCTQCDILVCEYVDHWWLGRCFLCSPPRCLWDSYATLVVRCPLTHRPPLITRYTGRDRPPSFGSQESSGQILKLIVLFQNWYVSHRLDETTWCYQHLRSFF